MMVLIAVIAGWSFAEGVEEESTEVTELVLAIEIDRDVHLGMGDTVVSWYRDIVAKEFTERTGIDIKIVLGTKDNQPTPLKARINAGHTPNVYTDYAGRVGLFSPLALPLNEYLPKTAIDPFYESYIKAFTWDGKLTALPTTSWVTTGHVNLDAFEEAGMGDVLDDGYITYDEVYRAATELKAAGYFAAPIFAAGTGGGDYWVLTYWFSGFGARLYDNDGNIALNSPEGLEALTTMKQWYDEGLIPFGAAGLGVGDFINQINTGKMITYSFPFEPAGKRDWTDIHTTTPRVEGVVNVPAAAGIDSVMAFDVGSEAEKRAAAQFALHIASRRYQDIYIRDGRFPSMYGVALPADVLPNFAITFRNFEANGVLDMGIGTLWYGSVRLEWMAMLQAIFAEELTVEEALDRFEKNATAMIIEGKADPLRFLAE